MDRTHSFTRQIQTQQITDAINKLEHPTTTETIKFLLVAIQ